MPANAHVQTDRTRTLCLATEVHYSVAQVSQMWNLDVETIRRLFSNEPGVIVIQGAPKKGKRSYKTIRIPQCVLDRVHRGLQR